MPGLYEHVANPVALTGSSGEIYSPVSCLIESRSPPHSHYFATNGPATVNLREKAPHQRQRLGSAVIRTQEQPALEKLT